MGRETNKNRREKQANTAREKAALARAQQKRAEQRSRAVKILSTVVVVVLIAVAGVVFALTRPAAKNDASGNRVTASPAVLQDVDDVSDATLATIGAGTNAGTLPTKVSGEPPLTSGGKPEMLYIGAEFCPYCAVERWALYEALSRFGTFTGGVGEVRSATDDGNYASLDFYGAKYTSKYLTFTPVENDSRVNGVTLQKLTAAQSTLWNKLEPNPKTHGYPFIDFGNVYATLGAPLDPTPLGKNTQEEIAKVLNDPSNKIAQTIGGGANEDIAAICGMTHNQPSAVCSTPTITGLQAKFSA